MVHMDKDTSELIEQLCTRIGMVMEDAIMDALTVGEMSGDEREGALRRIDYALERMMALIAAARALDT